MKDGSTNSATLPHRSPKYDRRTECAGRRPRLGFLGVGWIGRHRLQAVARSGIAEIFAIADLSPELITEAKQIAPKAVAVDSLKALLELDLDGIVIATPSALHAEQALEALDHGVPVFCQKPLGRNGAEARKVVEAAQRNDLLLGVDLSYRFVTPVVMVHELCRQGELGHIYAVDLEFHNAYGPDKPWFYNRTQSGGGCLLDLGIHLVDLALWCLGFPNLGCVTGRAFANGAPVARTSETVEDYAVARLDVVNGPAIRVACSWKLPAGCDAIISGKFYGTKGGAGFRNVEGSFYRFIGERYRGTAHEIVAEEPGDWGGRAAVDWAQRLARGEKFCAEAKEFGLVAEVLDSIYRRAEDVVSSASEEQAGSTEQKVLTANRQEVSPAFAGSRQEWREETISTP